MSKPRYFNNLVEDDNQIIKSSHLKQKIQNEYLHYYSLPWRMRIFSVKPKRLRSSLISSSYSMTNLNRLNLAEKCISGISTWESKYYSFGIYVYLLIRPKVQTDKETMFYCSYQQFIEKTVDRNKELPIELQIPKELIDRLKDAFVKTFNTRTSYNFKMSHGDLCLSNIIFKNGILRTVDPRGVDSLWLDEYYDLAKLSQSILGGYEQILEGYSNADHPLRAWFLGMICRSGINYNFLRICEASMFLSMVKFHTDNPKAINRFIQKADEILKETGF